MDEISAVKIKVKPLDLNTFKLDQSSMIEASAGTGKTYTITYLLLRLLLGSGEAAKFSRVWPLQIDNILIVTFTNAATNDLRLRIREKLRQARAVFAAAAGGEDISQAEAPMQALVEEKKRQQVDLALCVRILDQAEHGLDQADICTIHSFCYRALNRIYAFEAGEAFETKLADENRIAAELDQALNKQWRRLFYVPDPPVLLWQLLRLDNPSELLPFIHDLQKVRLTDPKAGSLGYALDELYIKADPDRSAADYLGQLRDKLDKILITFKDRLKGFTRDFPQAEFNAAYDGEQLFGAAPYAEVHLFLKALAEIYRIDQNELWLSSLLDIRLPLSKYWDKIDDDDQKDRSRSKHHANLIKSDPDKLAPAPRRRLQDLFEILKVINEALGQLQYLRRNILYALSALVLAEQDQLCADERIMSNDDLLRRLDFALNCRKGGEHLARMIRHRYPVAMIDEFQDTDPVQFSIFRKLYLDPEAQDQACCYFIGDPKQSIYAFRGSDLNSYLKARTLIEGMTDKSGLYTLDCNYRSVPDLVSAVNAFFSGEFGSIFKPPFLNPKIHFEPVKAKEGKVRFFLNARALKAYYQDHPDRKKPLKFDEFTQGLSGQDASGSNCAWYACVSNDSTAGKTKDSRLESYAQIASLQAEICLKQGILEENSCLRKVEAQDLAILVYSAEENQAVMEALRQRGIASVYYSDKTSVISQVSQSNVKRKGRDEMIPTPEARDLIFLMESLCVPEDRSKLLRLMASPLLGLSSKQFADKIEADSLEQEVKLLLSCRRIWEQSGFISAFSVWFKHPLHQGLKRLLSEQGGERRLTNYFHIAEIIQSVHTKLSGAAAQLRWFTDFTHRGDVNVDSSLVLKRLESEKHHVRILTIHKSKGLQFPIVIMPYAWNIRSQFAENQQGVVYYRHDKEQNYLDINAGSKSKDQYRQDALEEQIRLLYVALTRAQAAQFLAAVPIKAKTNSRILPFISLMGGGSDNPSACFNQLQVLKHVQVMSKEQLEQTAQEPVLTMIKEQPEPVLQLSLLQHAVKDNFVISSYSGIVSGLHDRRLPSFEGDNQEQDQVVSAPPSGLSPYTFPRGTAAGSMLHLLLQRTDFTRVNDPAYIEGLCRDAAQRFGSQVITSWSRDESQAVHQLAAWIRQIALANLVKIDDCWYSLSSLKHGDWIPEMSFLIPSGGLDLSALNALCQEQARAYFGGGAAAEARARRLMLDEDMVRGFITGSLDVVCRFGPHQAPLYYVIDYKSTYLGGSSADYAPSQTAASVFDPRNRYDVQFLFYTLALHRHLKLRLGAAYDYDKQVGGVIYLYIRALSTDQSPSSGVFFTKPYLAVIERLDRLMQGEKPNA